MSGQAVNLFSLLALVLVLGIDIDCTLFFNNPCGTSLTPLLAIALAILTTLLTLGILVFNTTQAINSSDIVLISDIFTALLLSPLAMPDRKRTEKWSNPHSGERLPQPLRLSSPVVATRN